MWWTFVLSWTLITRESFIYIHLISLPSINILIYIYNFFFIILKICANVIYFKGFIYIKVLVITRKYPWIHKKKRYRKSAAEYQSCKNKNKFWHPLTKCKEKPADHSFRIALTLDDKAVQCGRPVAVNVKKGHTNVIFGCSRFQKFIFRC